jgi:hypothetical protein
MVVLPYDSCQISSITASINRCLASLTRPMLLTPSVNLTV